MRIVWISVGLCLALLVVSFGFYEPLRQIQPAGSETAPEIAASPFAEDEAADTSPDQVTLAALPQDTTSANGARAPTERPLTVTTFGDTPQNAANDSAAGAGDATNDNKNTGGEGDSGNTPAVDAQQQTSAVRQTTPASFPSFSQNPDDDKVAVIVHAKNPQLLSPREIRAMYMDKLTRWDDGSPVMLYNLPLGDKHREQFSRRVLNMTALEADQQERERRENNRTVNPVKVKAKNIIVSYVERHPNAVAYVPLSEIRERSDVKILLTISD